MDMQKEREVFERLPEIAERLHVAAYVESLGFYHAAVLNSGHEVAYVNGAWVAWQAAKAIAVPEGFKVVPINYECAWCGCTELGGFSDETRIKQALIDNATVQED